MQVTQVYELMNGVTEELLGDSIVVNEDLSNVVDVGVAIANLKDGYDNYVKSLINRIGRTKFVDRLYKGRAPKVLMEAWEFGSILMKIRAELPEARENESWELEDGTSYDPNIFYKPKVSAKFFNDRVTYEIDLSFTRKQLVESFESATQLNAFYSMLETAIENSMTLKLDALVMRTINNFTAETIYAEFPGGSSTYDDGSGVRAINLLAEYNAAFPTATITKSEAMTSPEFIRYASMRMGQTVDRLAVYSKLFNIENTEKFSPRDRLHVVMLSDFVRSADVYLQADTFHKELTELPLAETVTHWQGTGTDFGFDSVSAINVKTSEGHTVSIDGILGVMFDSEALGVTNLDRRTPTNYNPKAEFWTNFHKVDAGYFNDFAENFVVFFIA